MENKKIAERLRKIEKMLNEVLGICAGDVNFAAFIYDSLPEGVTIKEPEDWRPGFDLSAHIYREVAQRFYEKHGIEVQVHANFMCTKFDMDDETRKEIERLSETCEIAEWML